jgi:CubicO group peptidase (beta-lactamase class C family)
MNVWQRGAVLGGVLLLGFAGAAPTAAEATADPDELDGFVAEQMERADVPGIAYAVVGPDGVEHQATFGEDGDGEPVTPATPFLWGSVAKPVTASLVVELAETGELDLDARVTTYLPDFSMADDEAQAITVRQLLSQTGGIPERMDLTDRYDADRRPGDVVSALADVQLAAEVGERHIYSSINYMLLGAVVEEATGAEFADVLRTRVLVPMGMDTAIADADDAAERLPPGHRYVLGGARAFETDYDPAGLSSGYLGGSLDDAVAFARANLSGSDLLSAEQRAALAHPEVSTGDGRSYGLGWRTWEVFGSDQPMVWHSGAAPGYQAGIILLPEQDRAVVVLQNVYGSFQESQLLDTSWGLASLLSGAEPERHGVDPLYVVVLVVLGLVCLVLAAALLGSLWRARRPTAARSRRRVALGLAGWLVGMAVVGAGLLALPAYFGVTLGQVPLWAPDVAVLLYVALVLVLLLAVCRVWVGTIVMYRTRR